jgi:hypothetical protein
MVESVASHYPHPCTLPQGHEGLCDGRSGEQRRVDDARAAANVADEFAAAWARLTPEQQVEAFLRAVLAFTQYAEGRNDPSDESVLGHAVGFATDATLRSKIERLDDFLHAYGVRA